MIMKNNTLSTTCVFDTAFSFLFYSTQIAYLSTLLFMLRPLPVWNRLEPSGYVRFPSGTVWLRPLPVWLRPLVVNLISRQQKPLLADFYFLRPAVMPCLDYCFFGIGI
jgi:hypothetical protein